MKKEKEEESKLKQAELLISFSNIFLFVLPFALTVKLGGVVTVASALHAG